MKKLSLYLIVLAATGAGCDDGEVALENLCVQMQDAMCDTMKRCEFEWYFELATHQRCEDLIDCDEFEFDQLQESIDAGRMEYDARAASDCFRALRAIDCAEIGDFFSEEGGPAACQVIFRGLVEEDGDCYRDEECQQGTWCDASVENCPGVCRAYLAMGEDCQGAGECDPDEADCDWEQGVCMALAGEGESCERIDCAESLVCDWDTDTCIRPGLEGDACSRDVECKGLRFCLDGTCAGPAAQGQACSAGEDYESLGFACQTGLYCDVDLIAEEREGTCQPKKTAGAQCVTYLECRPGLLCVGVTVDEQQQSVTPGTCAQPKQAGASCPVDFPFPECDYDLYCDPDSATCKRMPGEGDRCVYDEDPECLGDDLYCDSLEYGVEGTCRRKKAAGESCSESEECLDGYCQNGTCMEDQSCSP